MLDVQSREIRGDSFALEAVAILENQYTEYDSSRPGTFLPVVRDNPFLHEVPSIVWAITFRLAMTT